MLFDARHPGGDGMTDTRPEPPTPSPIYRASAVRSMESSDRLDDLLPVTSPRVWLLAVAAAVLVLGLLAYAAITPRNVTVEGGGRVTGKQGVTLVTATADGQMGRFHVKPETDVRVGQVVAEIITADGPVKQRAQRNGILLGYLPRPGDPVKVGTWIAEISNSIDDGRTALMMVDPAEAGKVEAGMPVRVSVVGGPVVDGVVADARSDVLSALRVQEGLGLLEPPPAPQVVIALDLDDTAPRGYEIDATVLVSERTLLKQLLGMS